MPITQDRKAKEYFSGLKPDEPLEDVESMVITHFLPGKKIFVDAVDSVAPVQVAIPKPSSIKFSEYQAISIDYNVQTLTREYATGILTELIKKTSDDVRLVLLDIGGYFAGVLDQERELVQRKVAGVIEDTINGEKKYESIGKPWPVPVASVARSPLKLPEDHNVGKALVFSVDAVLRDFNIILHGKRCLVIGYGPIGSGIASDLRNREAYVTIQDNDPLARTRAESDGYQVSVDKDHVNKFDLIVCATGGGSLGKDDLERLKQHCFVATATSSDEEFKKDALEGLPSIEIHRYVWEYHSAVGRSFYLINNGKAANFIHDAVIGEYIYLLQGEIIRLIPYLANHTGTLPKDRIITLPDDQRKEVAEQWERIWNTNIAGNKKP
ncbi:MAG: adenosylhomocysteinase [Patescibacteria group bacterium]